MDEQSNFGYLLVDTSRLYLRRFTRRAAALGVNLAQSKALGYLSRNQGITQVRLAELTDIEPMTLGRILDRMERDGWIERRSCPSDRRARAQAQDLRRGARAPVWHLVGARRRRPGHWTGARRCIQRQAGAQVRARQGACEDAREVDAVSPLRSWAAVEAVTVAHGELAPV